jgi:peroxiredoxin
MVKIMKMLLLLSIVVLGAAMASCSSTPAPAPEQPSQGDGMAPDFQLQNLDGQTVSLSSLRGRPVMLNFWATWCGPCQMEMPYMQEVFEDSDWDEQGLVLLAVNVGDSPSEIRSFMEDNGLSFTVLMDTDKSVALDYNVRGIPSTFFIDKNGIIKDVKVGTFKNKAEIDWRLVNSIMEDM